METASVDGIGFFVGALVGRNAYGSIVASHSSSSVGGTGPGV